MEEKAPTVHTLSLPDTRSPPALCQLVFNTVSNVCSQVQHQFSNPSSQHQSDLLVKVNSHTCWWMGLVRGTMPALVFLWFTWARSDGWMRPLRLRLPAYGGEGTCSGGLASIQLYLLDKRIFIMSPIPNVSLIKIHLNSLYVQQKGNIFTCIFKIDFNIRYRSSVLEISLFSEMRIFELM